MRPIRRGLSPKQNDFENYREALPSLISRIGCYCSYCERRIVTMLAVEHIQPKALAEYEHLTGRWENFLLSCVNCNSTKRDKDVKLDMILLPDRDNTFAAFVYSADGNITPACGLSEELSEMASDTLSLTGLNRKLSTIQDENGKQVALDRISQRMEAWAVAEDVRSEIQENPLNETLRKFAAKTAESYGFFSIWMTVFADDPDMRGRLIDTFPGIKESNCFDPVTTSPISPAPNPDGLPNGGKV